PLVLDATALRAEGISPSAVFTPTEPAGRGGIGEPRLFDRLGLVYPPCRPAPLLTTRRQLELWQAASGQTGPVSGSIAQALAEAAEYGRDSTGRFRSAAHWLRRQGATEEPLQAPESAAVPVLPSADSFGATWTEWET